MTLLSTGVNPDFYADLAAVDGQPSVYIVTLCDVNAPQRLTVGLSGAIGLNAFVMDLRGVEGNLSQLLTLADIDEVSILAIGGKRVVRVETSMPEPLPPPGFCPP